MAKQQISKEEEVSHIRVDRSARVYKPQQPGGSQRGFRLANDTSSPQAGVPYDGRFIDRSKDHDLEEVDDARRTLQSPSTSEETIDIDEATGEGESTNERASPNRPYDEYVVRDDPRFTRRAVSDFESMERCVGIRTFRRKNSSRVVTSTTKDTKDP